MIIGTIMSRNATMLKIKGRCHFVLFRTFPRVVIISVNHSLLVLLQIAFELSRKYTCIFTYSCHQHIARDLCIVPSRVNVHEHLKFEITHWLFFLKITLLFFSSFHFLKVMIFISSNISEIITGFKGTV